MIIDGYTRELQEQSISLFRNRKERGGVMQLVVEISEDTFFDLKKKQNRTEVDNAVINGTPLPKCHGRLIDADKFLKDNEAYTGWILNSSDWGGENAYKDALEDLVNEAPTIIEAESEE